MFTSILTSRKLGARSTAQFVAVVAAGAIGLGLAATTAQSGLDAIANNAGTPTKIASGKLVLTQAAVGGGFVQDITSLAPGDTRHFYVDVSNGELEAQALTLSVADNGDSLLTRHTTPANGLQVTVNKCSVAWAAGACSGTTTTLLTETPITSLNTSFSGTALSLAPGAFAANSTLNLKFTLKLPNQDETVINGVLPSNSIQGLSTQLTWTLREIQRNAGSAEL